MSYWNLYWVESDGFEDCFVVARNSRSACRVEIEMNGFEVDDVRAIKIMQIPKSAEDLYKQQRKYKDHSWPYYVYGRDFFEALGAQFRTSDKEEMLLENVVYTVDDYIPCGIFRKRSIGQKAILELREIPDQDLDEDIFGPEIHLVTCLGICLVRCQQIEHYMAHSFLLGISKKQKRKYKTINELIDGWKKKTLGNMLQCIEEAYEIEPLVRASFQLFLKMRNQLVHDITMSDQYNIETDWGQKELLAFLGLFDILSRIVRRAFKATFYASLEFGKKILDKDEKIPDDVLKLKPDELELIDLFVKFFTLKDGCV